jgi:hypothetical protein
MSELEAILNKHNAKRRPPADPMQIAEIIAAFRRPLPEDYRFFLENYEAFEAPVGRQYLTLWAAEEVIKNNKFHDVQAPCPSLLGIGFAYDGDMIAIDYLLAGVTRVVLVPGIGMEYYVCDEAGDSFTDFFVRLDNEDSI